MKERDLYFKELGSFHDFENIFNLVDEHDFFWTVDFWPVFKESSNNLHLACVGEGNTSSVRPGSFSRNWTMQYANCG